MPTKKRKQAQPRSSATIHSDGKRPYNVFISWSGARSLHVAKALSKWLPTVLQQAEPWLSRNIDKGARPLPEITSALETIEVGISCLTPENLAALWILFEGGALSKSLGDKTRLCTYLLGGLKHQDVPMPLGMFQHTRATKEETKDMIVSLNKVIGNAPLSETVLDNTFEKMWPDLAKEIDSMPAADSEIPDKRTTQDMIAEILEWVRQIGVREQQQEAKRNNQAMFSALFGKQSGFYGGQQPNSLTTLAALAGPKTYKDEDWFYNDLIRCPRCNSLDVAVQRGGRKDCRMCAATNH